MSIPKIQLLVENRTKITWYMIWMSPSALLGLGTWPKLLGLLLGPIGWQASGLACIIDGKIRLLILLQMVELVIILWRKRFQVNMPMQEHPICILYCIACQWYVLPVMKKCLVNVSFGPHMTTPYGVMLFRWTLHIIFLGCPRLYDLMWQIILRLIQYPMSSCFSYLEIKNCICFPKIVLFQNRVFLQKTP